MNSGPSRVIEWVQGQHVQFSETLSQTKFKWGWGYNSVVVHGALSFSATTQLYLYSLNNVKENISTESKNVSHGK